jgi:hypothetical protein
MSAKRQAKRAVQKASGVLRGKRANPAYTKAYMASVTRKKGLSQRTNRVALNPSLKGLQRVDTEEVDPFDT